GVKLHGIKHRRIKGITDCDLKRVVLEISRQGVVLEGHLGGDLVTGFRRDVDFAQVDKWPAETARKLLKEQFFRSAAFPADKLQERFLRTVAAGHAPSLLPALQFIRRNQSGRGQQMLYR